MSVADLSIKHDVPSTTPILAVDETSRVVFLDDELVPLTRTEFDLLVILYRNPKRVMTADILLGWLWDSDSIPNSHPIEVYIHRLRSKLGESGSKPHFIHTVRGIGYRFEPSPKSVKHRARLGYDQQAILRSIETTERDLWGWDPSDILHTRFVPTRAPIFRNKLFVNLVNRVCEAAAIRTLELTTPVRRINGKDIDVQASLNCQYEDSRLVGYDVLVTWSH